MNNIENISEFLRKRISAYQAEPRIYQVGSVVSSSDNVVKVKGLIGRKYGELLSFENGAFGMAFQLERDDVYAVMLSDGETVKAGMLVRGTDRVVEAPAGDELLGRMIDPIGRSLDGRKLKVSKYRPVENTAPSIINRKKVSRPLMTGFLSIDSMIPIGKGQRELIIGDRQTGKTAIAIDTIINQKNKDVICIYCAIAQKSSTIAQIAHTLKENGAMDYTIIVASSSADSPAMQYIAPYSACAIAEGFMYEGRDVLVVYDDLSKHATAYRTMALLLHRPPGREAYPGDVFYLHSRLLERAAQLSDELGSGSMTALPVVETLSGDISAYIPTNVISITDGQIFLETDLFNSGMRPAINVGLSVSRVGRAAQYPAIRAVSGSLRITLSKYRELSGFTAFGSDIDASTKQLLMRGASLTETLKQDRISPYSLSEQTALLLAFSENAYDDVEDTAEFNKGLLRYAQELCGAEMDFINKSGQLTENGRQALTEAIKSYAKSERN